MAAWLWPLTMTSPSTVRWWHRLSVLSAVERPSRMKFRDLVINSINGDYGRKEVNYDLSCDSAVRDPDWNMTLTWTGTQTSYNDAAIETGRFPALVLSFSTMVSVLS